jgi:hypothetical protein
MAAANSTPIQLYYSNTPGSVPTNTSLIIGELAINVPNGLIFYKNSSNVVDVIARTSAAAGRFPNVTFTSDGTTQHTAAMPWGISNAIWDQANTSTQNISIIQGVDLSQNSSIIAVSSYANSAYQAANSAGIYANASFGKVNSAFQAANSAGSYANSAFELANTNASAIGIIQGTSLTQNSSIETAGSYANSAFTQANTATTNAATADGKATSGFIKANSAFDVGQGAYDKANTNASAIAVTQGVDNKQNTDILYAASLAQQVFDYANTLSGGTASDGFARNVAQGAFDKANSAYTLGVNAVANTSSITLAGNLNVPGQANVNQRLAVGTGSYQVLPNLIAQFTGTSDYYSQVNQQNLSGKGTADFVMTADNGTDAANYMDIGMAGSQYDNTTPNAFAMVNPNDAYVMLVGDAGSSVGGNVYIGTAGSGAYADISFIQGNSYDESARFVYGQGLQIKTGTAASDTTSGALTVTGGAGISGSLYAGAVYDGTTRLKTYTDTANTYLQGAKVSKSGDTINGLLTINNGTGTALAITGNVTISKDLTINGNLIIGGNTTSISANNLVVDDSILYIANNNNGNSSDIGVVGHFVSDKYQHTGIVRDHLDGKWKLFSNVSAEPTTTIDLSDAVYDTLQVGTIETGNVVVGGLNVAPYLAAAYGTANAAFAKANTGGVRTITVASSNRLTANSGAGDVRLDLATTAVVAGTYTYPYLNVDAYGRITSINNQEPVTAFNSRTGSVSLEAGDVTGALGYSPVDGTVYLTDKNLQQGIDNRQNTNITVVGSYANAAFGRANASMIRANSAWDTANGIYDAAISAGVYANAAFDTANTVSYYANVSVDMSIAAGAYANAAYGAANASYIKANVVGAYANAGFGAANASFIKANNATLIAQGAFDAANTGISNADGASIYANGAFAQANAAFNNAEAGSSYANSAFDKANTGFIRANTAVSNAAGASIYANGAFAKANTNASDIVTTGTYANSGIEIGTSAGVYANTALGTSTSAFIKANLAYSDAHVTAAYANAAFSKANTALANTNGATFGGDLHVAGALDVITLAFPDGTIQNTSTNAISSYANSAYDKANSAGAYANAAYGTANAAFEAANNAFTAGGVVAGGYANAAFAVANSAYDGMIAAGSYANTAFGLVNAAFIAANTAYTAGGVVAGGYANSAYGVANAAFLAANSASAYANGAFTKANSAFTLAQDSYDFANTLSTGSASDTVARQNAQGAFDAANNGIAIGQGAFDKANTNTTDITALYGIENYQNTYIQLVETNALATSYYANAAFDAANNAYTAGGVVAGGYANAAFEVANVVSAYANAAFDTANTNASDIIVVGAYANAAFGTANTGVDIAQRAWNQANTSASFLYSVQSSPPSTPGPSDLWYDTSTDILFQYLTADGTNYFWIDIDSPTVSSNTTTISYTYTGYGRAVAHAMIFGGF